MPKRIVFYNLQCCRGLASVAVVLAHANLLIDDKLFYGAFMTGRSGVDFFFILSGFIIYYVNARHIGERGAIKQYASKRFVRIYPIFWVTTVGFLALNYYYIKHSGAPIMQWTQFTPSVYIKSFLLYPMDSTIHQLNFNPVAWTLSYEILFYILFAVAILINKRAFVAMVGVWIIAIGLASFGFIKTEHHPLLETITSSKNIEFMFGCVIAELTLRKKIIKHNTAILILIVSLAWLAISWANDTMGYKYFPKIDPINFGLPYGLIMLSLISLETFKVNNSLKKVLVYLGDASFSIYLVHWTAIFVLRDIMHRYTNNNYFVFTSICIFLILAGCACYSIIEKNLLKFLNTLFHNRPATYGVLK